MEDFNNNEMINEQLRHDQGTNESHADNTATAGNAHYQQSWQNYAGHAQNVQQPFTQYQNPYQYGYVPYQPAGYYPQPAPYFVQAPVQKKSTGWMVTAIIAIVIAVALLVTVIAQAFTIKAYEMYQNSQQNNGEYDIPDPWNWIDPVVPDGTDTNTVPVVIEDDYPGNSSITTIGGELPSITNYYNPVPEIIESTENSIGEVYTYKNGEPMGAGTGFVVHEDGYIVSNYHVAVTGDTYTYTLDKADAVDIPLRFVGGDPSQDIAVFKADVDYLVPLALGSSKATKVGELAIAVGCTTGANNNLPNTVTVGHVSYVGRKANYLKTTKEFLQIDTSVNPGNSGGPLLNGKGEVIGIVTWKSLISSYDELGNAINSEGLGFAIQIDDVKDEILKIIQSGSIVRPGIGIIYQQVTEEYAKTNNVPYGKLVTDFMAASPAKTAGMQSGDIIIKCNGTDLNENDILGTVISESQPGDKVEVTVWRNGTEVNISIIIGDMNRMVVFD